MHKLIANEKIYQTLAASIRGGRLSHALLIEGKDGCGKETFAGEIAQAILCAAPLEERPCGVCRDCVKAEKGIHPDILTYGGEGGARSFHIDTVRALRQEAFVRPNEAAGKVFILRNTQNMSVQAQNALLKIIEEPPRGVTFLLTCDNRYSMLETIRSRVQSVALATPTPEQCAGYLREQLQSEEPDRIEKAARQAAGNVGGALELLQGEGDAGDGDAVGELATEVLYNACVGDEFKALTALAAYERNRQGLVALLERMETVLSGALLHPGSDGRLDEIVKRAGRLRLIEILAIIKDTALAVNQNVNGLLLTTGLSARIRSVLAEV